MYVRTNNGNWDKQNADRVKDNLTIEGIDGGLQKDLLGWISDNPFYLVAKPFAGEYPGNREWNLLGSKLLYAPAEADGPTTHWDMVLNHIGRGLDAAVESDPWCQEYNLRRRALITCALDCQPDSRAVPVGCPCWRCTRPSKGPASQPCTGNGGAVR